MIDWRRLLAEAPSSRRGGCYSPRVREAFHAFGPYRVQAPLLVATRANEPWLDPSNAAYVETASASPHVPVAAS